MARVLIVDDDEQDLLLLKTILADAGHEIFLASNGEEAHAAVETSRPDLVSLDITMPEKSGVRFYREMRDSEASRGIPIIIVTGVTGGFEQFISTRSQVPPPDGFVAKPIDTERYLELVRQLTG